MMKPSPPSPSPSQRGEGAESQGHKTVPPAKKVRRGILWGLTSLSGSVK